MGKITGIAFSRSEGRVTEVRVAHKNGVIKLSGNDFRLMFPPKTVKSLFFTAQKKGQTLVLAGHGWGHGVGLCQWGARGMALQGMDFKKILGYYYRDTRLVNVRGLQNRSVALERAGFKRP
jgi:stage II sporulation protein D